MGNKTQRVRKGNAYGNSSLNDFHLPLPKPKRHKPKRPNDSGEIECQYQWRECENASLLNISVWWIDW